MNISDVRGQSWHTIACRYFECDQCRLVDQDATRIEIGTPCSRCGTPSTGGHMHFGLNVCHLVNSIQDLFFVSSADMTHSDEFGTREYKFDTDTRPIIAILYCTIFDVCMTQLTKAIMRKRSLPPRIAERLLKDYRFSSEKRDQLYPVLIGEKFTESLAQIAAAGAVDFAPHFAFLKEIAEKRNSLIHQGNPWRFTKQELEKIPHELIPLFRAFVALHNHQNEKQA